MQSNNKVYVGDTGTQLIVDCVQDISSATLRTIEVRKPDDSLVSWEAISNGVTTIRFDTMPGSLDIPGQYKVQPLVVMPSGVWRGATALLRVYPRFD